MGGMNLLYLGEAKMSATTKSLCLGEAKMSATTVNVVKSSSIIFLSYMLFFKNRKLHATIS